MTSMSLYWRCLWCVPISVGLVHTPTASAVTQANAATACTVSAGPSRRLELPDGRIVSVDVKSVAASGGSIMALGRYVYTFPGNASPSTSPLPDDSLVGMWIDANGVVRLVPSPLRDRSVVFARSAGGPAGSFHMLFVTGIDSVDKAPARDDSATIWYAHFARGSWGTPQRVTETRGAALNPEFTSELLARGDSLAFVFPFVDNRSGRSSGGLVALRRRNGHWSSDTLRTYLRPPATRVIYARNDTLAVLFSQKAPGAKAEDVYLARAGHGWSAPQRIGGNGSRPVSDLALVTVPDGLIASWSTWLWLNAGSNVIEWLRISTTGAQSTAASLDSGAVTFPFELVTVGDRYPLWLHQGEPYGSTVSWALAAGGDHLERGRLTIPFHNSRPEAVTVSPDRTVVLTMKRGAVGTEPMIASWTTDLRIRCPRAERR